MSTPKESTLEIKDFRGISRYLASPNNPPNKLVALQNLYSPNRGELAYIPGVEGNSLAADGFYNLIADFNFKGQRILAHQGLVTDMPNPIAGYFTFASPGGGSTTAYVIVTFSGVGYETDIAAGYQATITNCPTTGAGVLCTPNFALLPNSVCAVNFYISNRSGFHISNFVHCYTISRANLGTFPTTRFALPGFPVYASSGPPLTPQYANPYDKVSEVTFTPTNITGGQLTPGQTYYFAFCPYVIASAGGTPISSNAAYIPQASTMIDISSSAAPTLIISYTLPEGFNSVTVNPSVSGTYDLVDNYFYSYVFCGTTPEDMIMVCDFNEFKANTTLGPKPYLLSQLTGIGNGISVGFIPRATNLGLCTLTYAQSYPGTQSTPQFVRGCYFWTGGMQYDILAPTATGEAVAMLLFPPGQLQYEASPATGDIWQILPVRGAGMRTSADTGQGLVNGIIEYNNLSGGTTLTGTTVSGTNTIMSIPSTTGILVNMSVSGPGISEGAFVTAVNSGTEVTISTNATVSNSGVPLVFGPYAVYQISNYISLYTNPFFIVLHGFLSTDKIQGAVYQDRMFFLNNWQQPFYTNGFILKPLMVDAYTAPAPICSAIEVFQGSLVMAGGVTNNYNTRGNYYWSNATNPFSFSETQSPAPDINSANLIGNGPGNILGLGVFSYNEAVNSITTQLVIGLDSAIWMTQTLAQPPQETARNIGFAGPNCMVNTNIGAIFLGRDNLYQFNVYGLPEPKGNDVLQLLTSINKSNTTAPPLVLYTQNQVKIMYHVSAVDSATGADLYDTELWCDVQLEKNDQSGQFQPRYVWTGPHTIAQVLGATVFPTGIYEPSTTLEGYRTGFNSFRSFVLDYPGVTSNQTANVQRIIEFNDLYLNTDDFIKLFTRLYIGGRCTHITNIVIAFSMTDQNGAGQGPSGPVTNYTETMILNPNSLNAYQLFQKMFAARYRGRIVSALTLTWLAGASEETINIYELGLLFAPTKRRQL